MKRNRGNYHKEYYQRNKQAKDTEYYKRIYVLRREKQLLWNKQNRDKIREWKRLYNLKVLYGIDEETFKRMFISQKASCAICKERFTNRKNVHCDHCHDFNMVRGLLCSQCNHGLGNFADKPQLLRNAADYIEKWRYDHENNKKDNQEFSEQDNKGHSLV